MSTALTASLDAPHRLFGDPESHPFATFGSGFGCPGRAAGRVRRRRRKAERSDLFVHAVVWQPLNKASYDAAQALITVRRGGRASSSTKGMAWRSAEWGRRQLERTEMAVAPLLRTVSCRNSSCRVDQPCHRKVVGARANRCPPCLSISPSARFLLSSLPLHVDRVDPVPEQPVVAIPHSLGVPLAIHVRGRP